MSTDFTITQGLPFGRVIRVVDGRSIWPSLGDLEVRCQLRTAQKSRSTLVATLHDFMTTAYGTDDTANDIVITWSMTGAQTRELAGSGYYDLIVSDVGATDARAVEVLAGSIKLAPLVTTGEGDS